MKPHPKVVATTLVGAIATIVAATKGGADPTTLAAAILTLVQAAVGYITPAKHPLSGVILPPYGGLKGKRVGPGGGVVQIPGTKLYVGASGKVKTAKDAGLVTPTPKPRHLPHPIHHLLPFDMYDSVDVGQLPRGAGSWAVAGYVGGSWPTWWDLPGLFPGHRKMSIAVAASLNADCLDVEQGDATPYQAAAWYRRQRALGAPKRGKGRPKLYCNLSTAIVLIDAMARAGIPRSDYLLWVAHWTYRAHVCSRRTCGVDSDATQWTDRWAGRNVDASRCRAGFL